MRESTVLERERAAEWVTETATDTPCPARPCALAVLIGPPASGKGTIAEWLASVYGAALVQPGKEYQRLMAEPGETGDLVRAALSGGGIGPDDLTDRIIGEQVARYAQAGYREVIMDGYPRSPGQVETLLRGFDIGVVIEFSASWDDVLQAARHRRECAICGAVFKWSEQTNALRPCGHHDAEARVRWDDDPEKCKMRYDYYRTAIAPLLVPLRSHPGFMAVDGLRVTRPELLAQVSTRLSRQATGNLFPETLRDRTDLF